MHLYASTPETTRGRMHIEKPDEYRNNFIRDRDRILNSNAFRRLQYKAQVFMHLEIDHFRNRMTHSLEVAALARTIAKNLGVSEDLAETIALAHDLGHSPFGHNGEEALNDVMMPFGGFCHNIHTIALLTKLEKRYFEFDGLNLTWEVLEGLVKHNGPLLSPPITPIILEIDNIISLDLKLQSSLESQIAAIADDITYLSHDIEDAVRAGFFGLQELMEIEFFKNYILSEGVLLNNIDVAKESRAVYMISRYFSKSLLSDVINNTKMQIKIHNIKTLNDVKQHPNLLVCFSEEMNLIQNQVRKFLFQNFYKHNNILTVAKKIQIVVKELFNFYMLYPEEISLSWQNSNFHLSEEIKAEMVSNYIASMTDRYALKDYQNKIKPIDLNEHIL